MFEYDRYNYEEYLTALTDTLDSVCERGAVTDVDTIFAKITSTVGIDIFHTAIESDDHAFEIDANADGFGDVKAIDINYITGDIEAGDDEGVILINIDEILAEGGDLFAFEVLATEGNADKVVGLKVGVLIDPIHHDSGTFINPTTGTDNTTAVDIAAMIDGDIETTTAIFENNSEYILIGNAVAFQEIEFILTLGSSGAGIKPTFAYSTAGAHQFTEFSPVDGTNGFRNTGVVAWDASDLTAHAVNTDTGTFDIKVTRTRNSLSTTPVLGFAKTASTTEYIWDKDGDVNIKGLTISDLTSGRVPFISTDGLLIDDTNFTFAIDTLTVTKILSTDVDVEAANAQITIKGTTDTAILELIGDNAAADTDYLRILNKGDGVLRIQKKYNEDSNYYDTFSTFISDTIAAAYIRGDQGPDNDREAELLILAGNAKDAYIRLSADDADQNADKWRIKSDGTSSTLDIQTYASGSWSTSIFSTSDRKVFCPASYADNATDRDLFINSDGELGTAASSWSLKENIVNLTSAKAISLIKQLRPREFDYKDTGKHSFGLVTEEVFESIGETIPNLVSFKRIETEHKTISGIDEDGNVTYESDFTYSEDKTTPETINYSQLSKVMLPVLQNLLERIEELERKAT